MSPTTIFSRDYKDRKWECPHCKQQNSINDLVHKHNALLGKDMEGYIRFYCPSCKRQFALNTFPVLRILPIDDEDRVIKRGSRQSRSVDVDEVYFEKFKAVISALIVAVILILIVWIFR